MQKGKNTERVEAIKNLQGKWECRCVIIETIRKWLVKEGYRMEQQTQKGVVLITGASGGIGQATAQRFALAGYPVVLHYHNSEQKAVCTAQQLEAQGCRVLLERADLRDSRQVEAMVQRIAKYWGPVEILVNNAGIAQQKLFTDITDEEWRDMFAVHVDGAFYCARAVLPSMIHQRAGCIVNVSSMWGQTGGSCEVHYSAAKGALQAMTKALAKEVGPSGVRVNCVAPGVILTEMNTAMFDGETLEALREEMPLAQLGMPQDVANMIYFLCTVEAAYITGQVIGVNGGMVI